MKKIMIPLLLITLQTAFADMDDSASSEVYTPPATETSALEAQDSTQEASTPSEESSDLETFSFDE